MRQFNDCLVQLGEKLREQTRDLALAPLPERMRDLVAQLEGPSSPYPASGRSNASKKSVRSRGPAKPGAEAELATIKDERLLRELLNTAEATPEGNALLKEMRRTLVTRRIG